MKDESQNRPFDSQIDRQLAARIVALVLGEASDFDRDELNQLMAQRPELVALKDHIQDVHGLMLDVGSGEPLAHGESWKLSSEKRNKVLAVISGQDEVESSAPLMVRLPPTTMSTNQGLLRNFIVAAAVLLMGGFLFSMAMPRLFSSRQVATSLSREPSFAEDRTLGNEASKAFSSFAASDGSIVALGEDTTSVAAKFEAKIAGEFEPNAAENSKSALSSIRDSLASNPIATGMTAAGPAVAGTTLPSPYYGKSRQPETRYTREDPSKPRPSQEVSGGFFLGIPEAIDAAGVVDESSRRSVVPSWRVTRELGRPQLSFPSAETTPAQESISVSDGSTMLFGGVKHDVNEKSDAGVSTDSPVERWDSERADAKYWEDNPSSGPSSNSSSVPGEGFFLPAFSKEDKIAIRRSETANFSGVASVTKEGMDDDKAADREYDPSDRSMGMDMDSKDFGTGMLPLAQGNGKRSDVARSDAESKDDQLAMPRSPFWRAPNDNANGVSGNGRGTSLGFDDLASSPANDRGMKSETMRFGVVPPPQMGFGSAAPVDGGLADGGLADGGFAGGGLAGGGLAGEERYRLKIAAGNQTNSPVDSEKQPDAGAGSWFGKGLRSKGGASNGGRRRYLDSYESPVAQSVPESVGVPSSGQPKIDPTKPSDAWSRQLQEQDIDDTRLSDLNGETLQYDFAKNSKERQKTPGKKKSSDGWATGEATLDSTALNSHSGRQKFFAEKQSQLTDELHRKEITLKQAETIGSKAEDPTVALEVLGELLETTVELNSASQQLDENMVYADSQFAEIKVDKKLLPLMLKRNKQAAQFSEKSPNVKALDSELSVMKQELERRVKDQSGRMHQLLKKNEQGAAEPKTKAAEAVASIIYSSKAEVESLKSKIASIEQQAAREPPPATKSAAGLIEKTAQDEAFSTFSLHVSDVSFKLAQAALSQGEWPEAAKIRIEEFANAFDYGDPMPSQAEKVACRLEQCIHPFLQQRNLLRVAIRTGAAGRAGDTPLRLTLLLDNSGSMERIDRQQTVRRAFALLAQQLKPIDQITLISFARQPRLLADKFSGEKSRQLVQLIENLPSEGGTNIEAALQLAFEKALQQRVDNAQNRIILLTDGAVNLGNANPESLSRMITTMRDAGIAFDAAGIGADGLNDEVLEALTRKGDGRYYLLDSVEDADEGFVRQIAGALRPSAKNVKVQIEFNPKRVGRYKLLGFEKHRLKKEDFRDDKVDAAEMAAAEAGVAVYQFEAKPDGEGDVGSLFVRFQDLSTGKMIENCWPIPYEHDAPRADQAAASLRIATSAVMLAAKLRGERLGETVHLKTLSNLISGLPEQDRRAKRVQQLQLMIQQARQVSGN